MKFISYQDILQNQTPYHVLCRDGYDYASSCIEGTLGISELPTQMAIDLLEDSKLTAYLLLDVLIQRGGLNRFDNIAKTAFAALANIYSSKILSGD